jgi:hypothetical protein
MRHVRFVRIKHDTREIDRLGAVPEADFGTMLEADPDLYEIADGTEALVGWILDTATRTAAPPPEPTE